MNLPVLLLSAGPPLLIAAVTLAWGERLIRRGLAGAGERRPPGEPRRSRLTFYGWWAVMIAAFIPSGLIAGLHWGGRLGSGAPLLDHARWLVLLLLQSAWHVVLSVVLVRAVARRWRGSLQGEAPPEG